MKLLHFVANLTPFVMILSTFVIILAFIVKPKKVKSLLFSLGFLIALMYTFILMGVATPYAFLTSLFEDARGIIFMITMIFCVWCLVSLIIYLRNVYTIQKHDIKEIYIRDVDVEYSPAVLSYLMNNKVETKKDLSATLLDLCAKKVLKIEKLENGKIAIVDLKNQDAFLKLMPDEKYAHKILLEGVTTSKINHWKSIVENEYKKYRFSKVNNKSLSNYLISIFVICFMGLMLYGIISGKSEISGNIVQILFKTMFVSFMGAWEWIVFTGFKFVIETIFNNDSEPNDFKDSYTRKGAKEYNKWKKFEKFIEDFSIMKEREYESIVIWGKYLSYSIALGINKKCDKELYNKIENAYAFNYDSISEMYSDEKIYSKNNKNIV